MYIAATIATYQICDRPHDRDHLEDAGHQCEQQSESHLQDRKAHERHRRHDADEKHLPTDVAADQSIHLREQRDEIIALARGKNPAEPLK